MHARGMLDSILRDCLGDDPLAFLHGKRLECLVFEVAYLLAFVVVAHQPLE